MREGRSLIEPLETEVPMRFSRAAEVKDWKSEKYFEPKRADLIDRFAQFAVVAAREAIQGAALDSSDFGDGRTGVIMGTSAGGQRTQDEQLRRLYADGARTMHPLSIPRSMANGGASAIATDTGIRGPAFAVATACASSNHAIALALILLRSGVVDRVIAGGSESFFTRGFLSAWEALRVVSPDTCRPFSANRKGLILGEGAGVLVLEKSDVARARGARVFGELAGFGMSSDASHITKPTVEGPAQAMRDALTDAQLNPEQIGYINAHGTGTLVNDPIECRAIREVFGDHADRLAISSTKSMHGHALGASGALEAIATVLALKKGVLPPTANFTERDPDCDLDVIPNEAREVTVQAAISNAFAFGGLNAVLAFRGVS